MAQGHDKFNCRLTNCTIIRQIREFQIIIEKADPPTKLLQTYL